MDSLKAYYESASIKGVIDKWERKTNAYYSSFLTQREIGEQRIRLEVEKDGAKASKEFSLNVGLSEEEISQSPLDRNGLKVLWRDLLEDSELSLDREELFRKEYEIVRDVSLKQVEKPTSLYLKQLSAYLVSNKKSHENILKGLSLLLPLLLSKPWIVYGNMVEDYERAEFLINGEKSYLLAKFLSEMDVKAKHVYAARAMVDQMLTPVAGWRRIDPFEVFEYEGKKLQLWDLTKQLFQKHLEFEAQGRRASIADDVLIERWSDRMEINNNKHIYYGLRQCLLPPRMTLVDPVNRRYVREDDPQILNKPNKLLYMLLQWIQNYEKLNSELNEILRNPNKKVTWRSPIEIIRGVLTAAPGSWGAMYFPHVIEEASKDIYENLLFKGKNESKNPLILYGYSLLTIKPLKGLEEVRVELASCYGSLTGYPIYREEFRYPPPRKANHGEPSFILNREDEALLYKRSSKKLLIEPNTYSLNFLFTREDAVKKDNSPYGLIELPTWERLIFYRT